MPEFPQLLIQSENLFQTLILRKINPDVQITRSGNLLNHNIIVYPTAKNKKGPAVRKMTHILKSIPDCQLIKEAQITVRADSIIDYKMLYCK